jgi:AraC-like DNA-binding protein
METIASVDERLFVAHARRSSRIRRIELRSPWAFCFPETMGTAFHFVLEGACWLVRTAGSPLLPLGRGDLVLLPRGARHMLVDDLSIPSLELPWLRRPAPDSICEGGSRRRSLLLSGGYQLEYPPPILASLPEAVHVPADRCDRHGVCAIIYLLEAELEESRPGAATIVPALTDALLPLVVRAWLNDCMAGSRGELPETLSDPAIADALERIHEEPARDWTVNALAREVALSRSAFARRFARAVGASPAAYLARWRMTIAGGLLRDSYLKLAAVASRVGYTSEFAFAKAFKRDYGIAPGAYRRRLPEILRLTGMSKQTPALSQGIGRSP